MANEKRLIDANRVVEVAERAYNAWNLAMATADGKREINLVYKRQELCKAVKAVADDCPPWMPWKWCMGGGNKLTTMVHGVLIGVLFAIDGCTMLITTNLMLTAPTAVQRWMEGQSHDNHLHFSDLLPGGICDPAGGAFPEETPPAAQHSAHAAR